MSLRELRKTRKFRFAAITLIAALLMFTIPRGVAARDQGRYRCQDISQSMDLLAISAAATAPFMPVVSGIFLFSAGCLWMQSVMQDC